MRLPMWPPSWAPDLRVLLWALAYLRLLVCEARLATINLMSPEVGTLVVRRLQLQDEMRRIFPHPLKENSP